MQVFIKSKKYLKYYQINNLFKAKKYKNNKLYKINYKTKVF